MKQVQAVMAAAGDTAASLPTAPVMNEAQMAATDPAHAL